jgi:hypothetical protein
MGESENEGGESAKTPSFQAINRRSMTGDGEAPSLGSNAPSREASRGLVAEENHTGVNGRVLSKSSLSRLASPNLSTAGRTSIPDDSVRSGTATRRASTSSQMSSTRPVAPSYGTRSRKRPGASRPNYAEDAEMDFEMQHAQANGSHNRANSLSDPEEIDEIEIFAQLIREEERQLKKEAKMEKRAIARAAAIAAKQDALNSLPTEQTTPAADLSSVSASNTSTLPRKRKAAAVATQNMTASSQPTPPAAVNGKRNSVTANKTAPERETNMASFDKCNYRLNKDGNLVSDDGVVFAPNGTLYSDPIRVSLGATETSSSSLTNL